MYKLLISLSLIVLALVFNNLSAHDFTGKATYLGNEGVLIEAGNKKLFFDPFFHSSFGQYTLVPENIRQAIFAQQAPYDKVIAVFVSHAHGDHFNALDSIKYLQVNKKAKLYAPEQAVAQMRAHPAFEKVKQRVVAVNLKKDQAAKVFKDHGLVVEAVRIPHSGWPKRAAIENIVFRVTANKFTVAHFGDASTNLELYRPHKKFFNRRVTDQSFVPYWFYLVQETPELLKVINAKQVIGVHVPTIVPDYLKRTNQRYFSKPGEQVTQE